MSAQRKKTVLIVEDDSGLNRLLCLAFRRAGFDVMSCSNGRDALDCMRRQQFDGVTLDLVMPVMDGFAVLENRMQTLCVETPFFVVTAIPVEEYVVRAKALGARRVISKIECLPHDIIGIVRDELAIGKGHDGHRE
jgi:DNA-binding response OmpR family regulator